MAPEVGGSNPPDRTIENKSDRNDRQSDSGSIVRR